MQGLPSVSRAAVVREFKAPVRIEEVPIPKELAPGTLLTKIESCSICGTDVHLWQGSLAIKVDLPVILGHEMVGRVVAMGPGADRDSIGQDLKIGDRITWTHTSCGACWFCTVAREPTLCQYSRKYMYECMEVFPHCSAALPNTATCCRNQAGCGCRTTSPTSSPAWRVAPSVR